MTPQSCKQKGRAQQQIVRDAVLETFTFLKPADVVSTPMGSTGVDLMLSTAAREAFPYAVESRKQEKLNVWQAIADAQKHADKEGLKPLAVIGRNRTEPYAVIPLKIFMELVLKAFSADHPWYPPGT